MVLCCGCGSSFNPGPSEKSELPEETQNLRSPMNRTKLNARLSAAEDNLDKALAELDDLCRRKRVSQTFHFVMRSAIRDISRKARPWCERWTEPRRPA